MVYEATERRLAGACDLSPLEAPPRFCSRFVVLCRLSPVCLWVSTLAPCWPGWLSSKLSMPGFAHCTSGSFCHLSPRTVDDSPPLPRARRSLPIIFYLCLFFQRNGANVVPCGQLTGRFGPYANFMKAEMSSLMLTDVVRCCTYSNPDFCSIIDDQRGQGLLLVLPCGAFECPALHLHS